MRRARGVVLALVTPAPSLAVRNTAVCLGQMFGPSNAWWVPGEAVPDGSFALVRADDARVELATDAVASRSIFYAKTDQLFVASTSQRAIVTVLGSFERDPVAVSWVLSSGALPPNGGWDERISRVPADARVLLDRATWRLSSRKRPVTFRPDRRPRQEHAARLEEAVLKACSAVELTRGDWRLTLSGGYDSRCLLVNLSRRHAVRCITWGVASARDDRESDAAVASALAASVGAPHEFFPLDSSGEPMDVLFERFVRNGEGCVDHISGYMDGFALWRRLHDEGITGIVRGDEAFGWLRVAASAAVRLSVGATLLNDYYQPGQLERWGLAEQVWPAELERREAESLATWRDRLYQTYRIPVMLASLTDLKAGYVELVNPLLSRGILDVVRVLPDGERTDKVLFRRLVESTSPPVPFARRSAIAGLGSITSSAPLLAVVRREVSAGAEAGSLPAPFAEFLLRAIPAEATTAAAAPSPGRRGRAAWLRTNAVAMARKVVPAHLLTALGAMRGHHQPLDVLAFRAAIVARMARTLSDDARAAKREDRTASADDARTRAPSASRR